MALPAALILSGLPREQFSEDIHYMFNHGDVLLKSPSASSLTSSVSSLSFSLESGISSMSTESVAKSLPYYLDVISKLERGFQDIQEISHFSSNALHIKIMYENRDILNLAENMKSSWLFQHALLQHGIASFFENRSQYSRVNGACLPRHLMISCKENDCDFCEPKYY